MRFVRKQVPEVTVDLFDGGHYGENYLLKKRLERLFAVHVANQGREVDSNRDRERNRKVNLESKNRDRKAEKSLKVDQKVDQKIDQKVEIDQNLKVVIAEDRNLRAPPG